LSKKDKFQEYIDMMPKHGENKASKNVVGDFITHSENIENGKFVFQVKNGKNIFFAGYDYTMEDIYSCVFCGAK